MLGVVALSIVIGMARGLTFEVFSLAGWFVAYVAGRWLGPWLAPYLPVGHEGSALNRVVAFACAFLVVLVLWGFVTRAASAFVRATPLRPVDRLLGAVFGLARGMIVLLVVATVVAFLPASQTPQWRESIGAAWLESFLHGMLPWMPDEAAPLLRHV